MKKLLILSLATLIMGCQSHDLSYNPDESIKNNVRSIFGVDFPEWQDWIYDRTRNTEVHIATCQSGSACNHDPLEF